MNIINKFGFIFISLCLVLSFFLFSCGVRSKVNKKKKIDAKSIIQIKSGKLSGISGNNKEITVFKGIPYAAPPTGDLRWKAPREALAWEGVKKADTFCKSCPQVLARERLPWSKEYMVANEADENCLALNIWTPAKSNQDKLPVMMYIHGGGFSEGSGEVKLYDGESLAAKGIVVVTINYRLGILGFFAHPELTKESPEHSSGNYGLLDQIAALIWIKQNIAAFGGDPDNITIAGQSAGAESVHELMISPLAKGLFQKAIAQSTVQAASILLKEYEKYGQSFLDSVGKKSIAELRAMPADELISKSNDYKFRFRPILDGWVLKTPLNDAYTQRLQNDVPLLTGFNADEASARPDYGKLSADEFQEIGRKNFGDSLGIFDRLYPTANEKELQTSQIKQLRDTWASRLLSLSKLRTKYGKSKTFKYYFERPTPWPENPQYLAFHSSEIPYVFNNQHLIDRPWKPIDKKLSESMSDYWANFIKTGDPNGKYLLLWPSEENQMMRFGESMLADTILNEETLAFYEASWKIKQ